MERVGQTIRGFIVGLRYLWLYIEIIIQLHQARKDHVDRVDGSCVCGYTWVERVDVWQPKCPAVFLLARWRFGAASWIVVAAAATTTGRDQQGQQAKQCWQKYAYESFPMSHVSYSLHLQKLPCGTEY